MGGISAQKGGSPRTPLRKTVPFGFLQSCCGNCCAVATMIALEVKFPVNPVSLWDGELRWTGLFFAQWYGYKFSLSTRPRTFHVLKHPWSLRGSRGYALMGADGLGLQPGVRRLSDAVPSSLYSHSQRSCRPQPREVAETPPLARTQSRTVGCILNFNCVGPFFECFLRGSPTQ